MLERLEVEITTYLAFMDLAREEITLMDHYQTWWEIHPRWHEIDPPAKSSIAT